MPGTTRILVVANRTAATQPLFDAVRRRTAGNVAFHLLMPTAPRGLHRVVDPEDSGQEEAGERLRKALPLLSAAAGSDVTGSVGVADPVAAIQDALNRRGYDEIIISTLPRRMSRWMRLDLPSKIRGLGLPVLHVDPDGATDAQAAPAARVALSA